MMRADTEDTYRCQSQVNKKANKLLLVPCLRLVQGCSQTVHKVVPEWYMLPLSIAELS